MGYALCAGGSWIGYLLVADVDELQENVASEVYVSGESKQKKFW